jgi:hypothetical protein
MTRLEDPEKPIFDEYTPKLKELTGQRRGQGLSPGWVSAGAPSS